MVDGIGPIPGNMFGPLGIEVSELKNCKLNWKTVNKGKRSRKSVVRNSNGLPKLSSDSPVRVVDFSGSDSEKYVETPICPQSSNESPCVPLKKRRHILWTPPAPSPQQHQPSSDDDFSGIALLAATACNNNNNTDEEPDKNDKGGDMVSPSSVLGRCHTLVSSSIQSGDSVSCSDQKDVLQIEGKKHGCFPEVSYVNTTKSVSSEADALHHDLGTLMEACKEKEASFNCIPKEKIHGDEFDCKSNASDVKHMPLGPVDDGGNSLRCSMPKDSEHQTGILEVTGSEISELHENDIQMKEEEGVQKAYELAENGTTTFVEGMIIKTTLDTITEASGITSKSEGIVLTSDKGLVSDEKVQESIKTHIYEKEDHVQMDYDSPYEDGELRGPVLLNSRAENELEDGEHECVDYESEGRVKDGGLDSIHYHPGPEDSRGTEESLGIINKKEFLVEEDIIENLEKTEGKNVPVQVDSSSEKRKCPFDIAVSRMEEMGSKKVTSEKWRSCTEEGWPTSGRFGKVEISRSERENRYGGSSSLHKYRQTEGGNNRRFSYPDSSRHGNVHHQPPRYHQIGDSIGRGRSQESNYHHHQPEGIIRQQQSFSRRRSPPPVKRFDDFRGANTKVANIRSYETCSGGYFREEYDKLVDDVDVERSAAYARRMDRMMRGPLQREEFVSSSPRGGGQFLHSPPPNSNRFVHETIFLSQNPTRQSPRDMFRQDHRLSDTRYRDEFFDEHYNNGRRLDERCRYPDKRCFRFEDGHCDDSGRGEDYYNRRGGLQRSFDGGDYEESLLYRSGWAGGNEGNFVRSPSRYTRSPIRGGGGGFGRNERLGPGPGPGPGPVSLSGQQRKSNDYYSTQSRRDGSFAH